MTAIVVDDEMYGREAMISLLNDYCPDVEIAGTADNALTAIKEIRQKQPDIVFLDIEMPHGSGFDVLEGLGDLEFEVVFTTAYDHYAIQAIRFSAIDYLLKPIDHQELKVAVERARKKRKEGIKNRHKEVFIENLKPGNRNKRISIPVDEGYIFIEMDQIIRLDGDGNYTYFFLKNNIKYTVVKALREYEELLKGTQFMRIHQSAVINLDCVAKYIRGRGGSVIMSDGAEIEVSRRKKDEFLAAMSGLGTLS